MEKKIFKPTNEFCSFITQITFALSPLKVFITTYVNKNVFQTFQKKIVR